MRFRTAVFLALLAVSVGVVVLALGVMAATTERAARRDIAADLHRARQWFERLHQYRQELLRARAGIVADEPRLKAVLISADVTRETIVDEATQMRDTVGADRLLLVDADGLLLVDVSRPEVEGSDLSADPLVVHALEHGEHSATVAIGSGVFEMQSRRMRIADRAAGVLVIGYQLDDRLAQAEFTQRGEGVVVVLDGHVVAAAGLPLEGMDARNALGARLASIAPGGAPVELELGGTSYLAVASKFVDYDGERPLSVVTLHTLADMEAELRATRRGLYLIGLLAGCAALVLAFAMARRLMRPLDRLVAFTREIAVGDAMPRRDLQGPFEMQQLGKAMNEMVVELAESRRELAARERLRREVEIAGRMQSAILPRKLEVPGANVVARMMPATEVGGDYYDVLAVDDGCWLGFGDVAGHGLPAGILTVMLQSAVAALVRSEPNASPKQLLVALNEVIFTNVRRRMEQDEYATLTLLRYRDDGDIVFAGAHEELLVVRAADGSVERLQPVGTWVGAVRDIERATEEGRLHLEPGDLLVLFSDGVIEATSPSGERFGLDRLIAEIERRRDEPVGAICTQLFETIGEWTGVRTDDATLLLLRRT